MKEFDERLIRLMNTIDRANNEIEKANREIEDAKRDVKLLLLSIFPELDVKVGDQVYLRPEYVFWSEINGYRPRILIDMDKPIRVEQILGSKIICNRAGIIVGIPLTLLERKVEA